MNGHSLDRLLNNGMALGMAHDYLTTEGHLEMGGDTAAEFDAFVATCAGDQNIIPHLKEALIVLLSSIELIINNGYFLTPEFVGWVDASVVRFSDAIRTGDLLPDFEAIVPFYYHRLCEWMRFVNGNDDADVE